MRENHVTLEQTQRLVWLLDEYRRCLKRANSLEDMPWSCLLERIVHDFVQTRTEDFLTSDRGQALWQAQVRRVHAGLVALLRGHTSTLGSANGAL